MRRSHLDRAAQELPVPAELDAEGRKWLARALAEFRACQTIDLCWVSPELAARTLRPTAGKEIVDAEIDDNAIPEG